MKTLSFARTHFSTATLSLFHLHSLVFVVPRKDETFFTTYISLTLITHCCADRSCLHCTSQQRRVKKMDAPRVFHVCSECGRTDFFASSKTRKHMIHSFTTFTATHFPLNVTFDYVRRLRARIDGKHNRWTLSRRRR